MAYEPVIAMEEKLDMLNKWSLAVKGEGQRLQQVFVAIIVAYNEKNKDLEEGKKQVQARLEEINKYISNVETSLREIKTLLNKIPTDPY